MAVVCCLLFLFAGARAQDDPNAQYIVLQSGELRAEGPEIVVPVEVGVWRLQFDLHLASASAGEADWTIITPSGKPLVLSDPNVAIKDPTNKRSILIWDPRPGIWKIRLAGKGKYTLSATTQGELYICCIQTWGRNGVSGIERLQAFRGQRQQAQAYASGFNIDAIQFDMVTDQGQMIAPLKFRQSDFSNPYNFTLMLEMPDQPFRVRARGRDLNGKSFQRIFYPLVRPQPIDAPVQEEVVPANPQWTLPQEWNKTSVEGEFKIVRAQVVEWSDEPLVSDKGNPIGIRLKYAIRFPVSGSYAPQPQVYPERISQGYTGALGMRIIRGTVEPAPDGMQNPQIFFSGGRAEFKGGDVYRFTVDLIPVYAAYDDQKKTFCINTKSYNQPGLKERFDRELISEQKTRYRVSFAGTDLDGRLPALTENVYVPNVWYQGFSREKISDCP